MPSAADTREQTSVFSISCIINRTFTEVFKDLQQFTLTPTGSELHLLKISTYCISNAVADSHVNINQACIALCEQENKLLLFQIHLSNS